MAKKEAKKDETKTETKLATVDIKGKEYVMVNERVREAHRLYGDRISIRTEILEINDSYVRMKATVTILNNEFPQSFNGHAEELRDDPTSMVNKYSALENCETSAIGRALGALGIGILESYATGDEIKIAEGKEERSSKPASEKQKSFYTELYMKVYDKVPEEVDVKKMSSIDASREINRLIAIKKANPDVAPVSDVDQRIGKELDDAWNKPIDNR